MYVVRYGVLLPILGYALRLAPEARAVPCTALG